MIREISYVGIDEHSTAGAQRFAVDTYNLTIIHSDVARGLDPGSDLPHACLDVAIQYHRS